MFLAVGLSTALVLPFMALFLSSEVHAGPVRVTVFLVAAPLAGVLVASGIGRLSDRRPIRRWILVGAALSGVAGTAVTAVVRDYWVLLALTIPATAVAGCLFPQTFAYARQILQRDNPGRSAVGISAMHTVSPRRAFRLLAAGASRQQVEDAPAVCVAFNITGRLADVFGFEVLSPAGAKHLLKRGYR